jgi:hypothetical protein
VVTLQVGTGFIPGVGILVDLFIDVLIEGAACFVEKKLKQDEYTAKINKSISAEERKLLNIMSLSSRKRRCIKLHCE